jgi:hypothetical protein
MDIPEKKLKTYNITFRKYEDNPYSTEKVTYSAENMNQAKELFYKDYPEQKERVYLEIHSPLSNYEIEEHNRKIEEAESQDLANYDPKEHQDNSPENSEDNNNTTTTSTTSTTTNTTAFDVILTYTKSITLLLTGIILLSILSVAIFGSNKNPFYIVIENIGNIINNLNSFSGFIVLFALTAFLANFYAKNEK